MVSSRPVPVRRAGLYVPGGLAAYPSSAVMAIVPAQVAGVPGIAVCSPPGPDGLPHATALAACGAARGRGGVRRRAAPRRWPRSRSAPSGCRAVDLVAGPGNAYVEEAKRRLFGEVGIESLAGPSELVVVADATAPAEPLAWDLLAQLEHGPGRTVGAGRRPMPSCSTAVAALLPGESSAVLIEADSTETAFAFVNAHAPEHVQLVRRRSRGRRSRACTTRARSSSAPTRARPSATTSRARTTSCPPAATAASRPGSGRPRSCGRRRWWR